MQSSLMTWLRPNSSTESPARPEVLESSAAKQNNINVGDALPSDKGNSGPAASHGHGKIRLSFKPPFGPTHRLSDCAKLSSFSERHLQSFKRLNAVMLPVPYPDKFYREILDDPATGDITRVITWTDKTRDSSSSGEGELVAGIRCRLLSSVPGVQLPPAPILYISTIGTLAPYRNHSLATHLLADVAMRALHEYGASTIVAHTWEANEDGIEWYKRRGFRVIKREEHYYRRLYPRTAALVMAKDILPSDLTGSGSVGCLDSGT